jgi:hypothetical protein
MARTGVEEWWGGYMLWEVGANVPDTLPLPAGAPGAARMIEIGVNSVGGGMTLPDATLLPLGGPLYTLWARGTSKLVRDAGANTVVTLAQNDVAKLYLMDNSTANGQWAVVKTVGETSGDLSVDVEEFEFEFGPGNANELNLRTLCDQAGYSGQKPARVRLFVGPQNGAAAGVIGGLQSQGVAAIDTGVFPTGSLVVITVLDGGHITGRGGTGGAGQPITGGTAQSPTYGTAGNGGQGGDGLHVRCDTVLYNYGRVQGGGGGGPGGGANGAISGSGGGGGAGWTFGVRGLAGSRPNANFGSGQNGIIGTLNTPGAGGANPPGGAGGGPGQNGQVSSTIGGGSVGVAGYAIRVASNVTLTKAVAGTIEGLEGVL